MYTGPRLGRSLLTSQEQTVDGVLWQEASKVVAGEMTYSVESSTRLLAWYHQGHREFASESKTASTS
jgi:hypothetical protein